MNSERKNDMSQSIFQHFGIFVIVKSTCNYFNVVNFILIQGKYNICFD